MIRSRSTTCLQTRFRGTSDITLRLLSCRAIKSARKSGPPRLMNKVKCRTTRHVDAQQFPTTTRTTTTTSMRSFRPRSVFPHASWYHRRGTMLRYGYQPAHKTALALSPYAGRLAEFIRRIGKGRTLPSRKT